MSKKWFQDRIQTDGTQGYSLRRARTYSLKMDSYIGMSLIEVLRATIAPAGKSNDFLVDCWEPMLNSILYFIVY